MAMAMLCSRAPASSERARGMVGRARKGRGRGGGSGAGAGSGGAAGGRGGMAMLEAMERATEARSHFRRAREVAA